MNLTAKLSQHFREPRFDRRVPVFVTAVQFAHTITHFTLQLLHAELAAGRSLETRPQPGGGQYFSFPGEDDLTAFRDRGLVLLDPAEVNAIAHRFIEE